MPPSVARKEPADAHAVSQALIQAERFEKGSTVWIEDEEEAWAMVRILGQENTLLRVCNVETGEEKEIDLGFADVCHTNPKVVADMTGLHHINEPGILHNLQERSKLDNQRPYNFMGTILICVNPLRPVPDPPLNHFVDKPLEPEEPHPYAIAELSYQQMCLASGGRSNQSIVVSGESGAGKTETAKMIMNFIAKRTKGGVTDLDRSVIDSSPILEIFGNAKTLRNHNSSRFGKFLKLQFAKENHYLMGGFIETYLLEKTRVICQASGERNFHIFYAMLTGLPRAKKAELGLGEPMDFRILNHSGIVKLDEIDDAEQFQDVSKALDTIHVTGELQDSLWAALAAVLHLANVDFVEKDSSEGPIAVIRNPDALKFAAKALKVEEASISSLITTRDVNVGGETLVRGLSLVDAVEARDSSAKALYEAVFKWVVSAINRALIVRDEVLPFIGVLDIFGFENFAKNELEQLLINFTNESLQNTFNHQVFSNELMLYEAEGIEVAVSSCPDNSACLQLLAGRGVPKGIVACLDDICNEPNASDLRYCEQLHISHGKGTTHHQNFPRVHPKDQRENFIVRHYAGKVKYSVMGWIVRNQDKIPAAFTPALGNSKHGVVSEAVKNLQSIKSTAGRKATVARAFLKSMEGLNKTILSTTCNFVRCIKPNYAMTVGHFHRQYVVDQLQCLGILQTCEVLKVGMPTRVTYTELRRTLGKETKTAEELFRGEPETALISAILFAYEIPCEQFRLGRSRVFFKAGQISTLEKILRDASSQNMDKVLARLKIALENRKKAAKSAAEIKYQLDKALKAFEKAIASADEATAGAASRPCLSEVEYMDLDDIMRKSRPLCDTYQIDVLMRAIKEDNLGKYAPKALERVFQAEKEARAAATTASEAVEALEGAVLSARGGDTDSIIQRLSFMVETAKGTSTNASKMVKDAEEAADKCMLDRTLEKADQSNVLITSVLNTCAEIESDCTTAKTVTENSAQALESAKTMAIEVSEAAGNSLGAWNSLKAIAEEAQKEESEAERMEMGRIADEAAANAATAAVKMAEAAEKERVETPAVTKKRGKGDHSLRRGSSVHDVLSLDAAMQAAQAEASQQKRPRPDEDPTSDARPHRRNSVQFRLDGLGFSDEEQENMPPEAPEETTTVMRGRPVNKEDHKPTFIKLFDDALDDGTVEGYLMKQSKFFSRWRPRYFVLEDEYLEYYEKKSLVGTQRGKKSMQLQKNTITSYTNTQNCFCVRTGENVWFLLAKDEENMTKWMTAINAQIHALYLKSYELDKDEFWNEGVIGRYFYRMVDGALPQWIRAYPEPDAPRTGEGLFPGEVIEVIQVLSHGGVVFLRIADGRGWTFARQPTDNTLLFEEIYGDLVEDDQGYSFRDGCIDPVPILLGPGLESQPTGDAIMPGDPPATAVERFVPNNSNIMFVKLANGRGWAPIQAKKLFPVV